MQRKFIFLDGLYLHEICLLIDTIIENKPRKQSAVEVERPNRKKGQKQKKGRYIQAFSKKGCFVNKTTRTSRATSNTYTRDFNAYIPHCSGSSSGEEEDIGMCKCRRKINAENKNVDVKGKRSEVEEIKIPKCIRRIRVEITNKEVKGWISSSKQQDDPTEPTKTKEDISPEQMKRKVKRAALEWDDFVLQE